MKKLFIIFVLLPAILSGCSPTLTPSENILTQPIAPTPTYISRSAPPNFTSEPTITETPIIYPTLEFPEVVFSLDIHEAFVNNTDGYTHNDVDSFAANGEIIINIQIRDLEFPTEDSSNGFVIATMKSYDVPVYVTEFDVNMKNVYGTEEERYLIQARIYGDMVEACLESGVCNSFHFWGIGDSTSWIETMSEYQHYSTKGDPTMYDDYFNHKPAYFSVIDVLSEIAETTLEEK